MVAMTAMQLAPDIRGDVSADLRADLRPVPVVRSEAHVSEFLGFRFDRISQERAQNQIMARPADAPFAYVVTPNVDHVVRLRCSRSDLWPIYRRAWMTLCDSRILAKLAAREAVRLPVTPGSDLTAWLFGSGLLRDERIAIVGGSPALIEILRDRYQLRDVVHHNPIMGFAQDPAALAEARDFVAASGARFTFLAVGSPQQEILAYAIHKSGKAKGIGLCVGASLEFLSGDRARAPRILQALSLEWLFRLLSNPMRMWRRYLVDGPLIFSLVHQWHNRSISLR